MTCNLQTSHSLDRSNHKTSGVTAGKISWGGGAQTQLPSFSNVYLNFKTRAQKAYLLFSHYWNWLGPLVLTLPAPTSNKEEQYNI